MDEEIQIVDCRAAMLELNLSADGMAKLLGVTSRRVNQMCLLGERIPLSSQHQINVLLNMHRYNAPRPPALTLRQDLLRALGLCGVMSLKEAKEYGLSAEQIKNVERVDGFVRMVWNMTPTGLRPFVYLTLKGYDHLGLIMPEDGPFPPSDARPVEIKTYMSELQASIIDTANRKIAAYLKGAENWTTIRWLAQSGYEDAALRMSERLEGGSDTRAITNGSGTKEIEGDHENED